VRVRVGRGLPPALQRMADRVGAELASAAGGDATVAIGADDSLLPGPDPTRPLVVAPACGPGAPTPWGEALVRAADAVALFDPVELHDLRAALAGRPVVVVGLPAPEPRDPEVGVDHGGAPDDLRAAWYRHGGGGGRSGVGVAWISGRGLTPIAEALEAWAAGRAVVALPGVPPHDLLRRAGVLHARTPLEAVEATRFLMGAPALAASLGARGREIAMSLPCARGIARAVVEAVELARQSAGGAR
jgi:hypothetical protein